MSDMALSHFIILNACLKEQLALRNMSCTLLPLFFINENI